MNQKTNKDDDDDSLHARNTMAAAIENVPYFVLPLEDGRAKAIFTVPEELAQSLIAHPILCRGSSFALQVDEASRRIMVAAQQQQSSHRTSFLSTEFYSHDPQDTALDISRRIAIRLDHCNDDSSFQLTASSILGGL